MGYSPTEYAEFTEPPAEMSSHGFLLRRVWHLAILTPLAMGYSPTEFTEPPTEKSLPQMTQMRTDTYGALFSHRIHRIHRIWQRGYGRDAIPSYICEHPCHLWEALLCQKFLCVPCVLWEYLFSHGFHRFTQILRVRCSPTEFTEYTEFGSVGMAGMPYPPTSVNIRVICGRLFSARSFCAFRAFCGNIFSPTDFTDLHRCLECAVLQQNTEFGSVGMAGMPYPPTSVLICVICGRFFSARSFRVFRAFCGNLFPPTDFTDLHRCLGCALFPRNPQNPQNLAAWVWQGCHTLLHL